MTSATTNLRDGEYARMSWDGTPYQSNATGVTPRFFKDSLVDPERTRIAKKPVFFEKENEYVELISPGDIKSCPVKKVTQDIIDQFPDQYAAWKRGEIVTVAGHPLESFRDVNSNGFSVGELKTLRVFNVETIEQLANVPDTVIQQLGMGYRNRQNECRAFLASLEGQKDQVRDDRIAELEKKIAELTQMKLVAPVAEILGDIEPIKRGPGRPRKTVEEGEAYATE